MREETAAGIEGSYVWVESEQSFTCGMDDAEKISHPIRNTTRQISPKSNLVEKANCGENIDRKQFSAKGWCHYRFVLYEIQWLFTHSVIHRSRPTPAMAIFKVNLNGDAAKNELFVLPKALPALRRWWWVHYYWFVTWTTGCQMFRF